MLARMRRGTTPQFCENNCLKLFGLMLRQFERLGPRAEIDQCVAALVNFRRKLIAQHFGALQNFTTIAGVNIRD
jgi:hypothetical protein